MVLVGTEDKARRLLDQGKVVKEIDTDRRTHFKVSGETEEHSVVFNKSRGKYTCDCRYSSMQDRECSHIIACKMMTSGSSVEKNL